MAGQIDNEWSDAPNFMAEEQEQEQELAEELRTGRPDVRSGLVCGLVRKNQKAECSPEKGSSLFPALMGGRAGEAISTRHDESA